MVSIQSSNNRPSKTRLLYGSLYDRIRRIGPRPTTPLSFLATLQRLRVDEETIITACQFYMIGTCKSGRTSYSSKSLKLRRDRKTYTDRTLFDMVCWTVEWIMKA